MTFAKHRLFSFLACMFLAVWPAHAWNSAGHQVVSLLAYNHLDPDVKARCDALMAVPPPCGTTNGTFITLSTWADERCEPATTTQHYFNTPISLDGSPTNGVAYDPTNAMTAIRELTATLQNPASSLTEQGRALRYLVHFVGDIHQPLHCATGVTSNRLSGDAGGNSFGVTGWGNLHSLWDAGCNYNANGVSITNKVADIEASYPYATSVASVPDPKDWAVESWQVAATVAYVGITTNTVPSAAYTNAVQAATKQRLALAGQRLAKLLNTILMTNTTTVTVASLTNSSFNLSWSAVVGRHYRVQWRSDVDAGAWTESSDISASSTVASYAAPVANIVRFYRVVVVN